MSSLDLKTLVGKNDLTEKTNEVIDNLLGQIEDLSVSVEGTGDLLSCAINLGDMVDLDLDLDFFATRQDVLSYTLLYKIQQLKKYINNINNIFIEIVGGLECCNSDDMYNKMILPIFKWLVEDENGLCGTLLKISKELYNIYIPIKRLQCMFKPLPGNPTVSYAGYDWFKTIYPIIEGIEKAMNMLDNGRFLDILIIPVKNFHDKLVICSNGENVDLYTKYDNIKDIISLSIYDELTVSLIDELKQLQEDESSGTNKPTVPTVPNYSEYYDNSPRPLISNYTTVDNYRKALYNWNIGFTSYKRDIDRDYNKEYSNYIKELTKYKDDKFKETLSLDEANYSSSDLTVDMTADQIKEKYSPVCGCLAEIFNADGFFLPQEKIIRTEADLRAIIGEVEFTGYNSEDYYFNDEKSGKRRIKIIKETDLIDIRLNTLKTNSAINISMPFVNNTYMDQINSCVTIEDVISLNTIWTTKLDTLTKKYKVSLAFGDTVKSAFKLLYNDEIKQLNLKIAKLRAEILVADLSNEEITSKRNEIIDTQKLLTNYAFLPPTSWDKDSKKLTGGYASGIGSLSYAEYETLLLNIETMENEIADLKYAIERNHAVFEIVSDADIECGCDLVCMIIKYIIGIILAIIKKLITYIVNYIVNAIMNKELQWWLEFISRKISCILGIVNMGSEIDEMREKFEREIASAQGLLKEASDSLANCATGTSENLITDMVLFDERAKVNSQNLVDTDWEEVTYPTYETVNDDPTNTFDLELVDVTYEETEWKNRSVPTLVLDCTLDHVVKTNWVPETNSWSSYLNISITDEQFNNPDTVILNGNAVTTEDEIILNTFNSLVYNILHTATKQDDFEFKIEIDGIQIELNSNFSSVTETELIYSVVVQIVDIDRIWFVYEDWVKVFDRLQISNLETLYSSTKETMIGILDEIASVDEIDYSPSTNTSSKVCSADSLVIETFKPLYNDPELELYPGELINNSDKTSFVLSPKITDDGWFTKNNVPYLLELVNKSGRIFTVILLIDICNSNNVKKTSYDKSVDGIFLNGRYDYVKYGAIPNNIETIITFDDLFEKLSGFLKEEGIISSLVPGILGQTETIITDTELIDNTEAEEIYDESIDISGDNDPEIGYNNLPNGPIKDAVYKQQAKAEFLTSMVNDMEAHVDNIYSQITDIIDNNYLDINGQEINFNNEEINFSQSDSKLGIPLMVLNEEDNIILTIHNKKLKLININRNIGITNPDLVIDTPIDYIAGENLFIEFSTNGFTHTISWTNERKIQYSASVVTTTLIELLPTYIGSVYKNNQKIALLCGKVNDIIFTNTNRGVDEWYSNSNSYQPDGTIGWYDFSLFDGYHVYSIPPFFRITTFGELATVKGLLYESDTFSNEEIAIMIQDNELNKLKQTKLTIVGERPISVGGDFIWQNKKYYKNVTFGYLDNFFCRDNLKNQSFTISFWLKQKDAVTNNREETERKYIFADTNNGNFIWLEDDLLYLQFYGQDIRTEPVRFLFKEDIYASEPVYVEKWFHHVLRYDYYNAKIYYDIISIDQDRNFDNIYQTDILYDKKVIIDITNTPGKGKVIDFSLVSMLARYDMTTLKYVDLFLAEITALAIWAEYKTDEEIKIINNYQKKIIINETS